MTTRRIRFIVEAFGGPYYAIFKGGYGVYYAVRRNQLTPGFARPEWIQVYGSWVEREADLSLEVADD